MEKQETGGILRKKRKQIKPLVKNRKPDRSLKKKQKPGSRLERFKLLNPKNLQKEIHIYGYNFSWRAHILFLICSLLGIGAIGILFKLKPAFLAVTIAVTFAMFPALILDMYRKMYEQKRFGDAVTYMEQILYSFQKSGKIILALRETGDIFEDGQMKDAISKAVSYLESGKAASEKGVLREALELIEKPYECAKMHTVHELLINSEEYGGDTENSIYLLLQDIELWKRRGYRLQAEKKTSHTNNIISIVVATMLCAVALYVLDSMRTLFPAAEGADIFQVGVIQISSLLFLLFMLFVLLKSVRSLTKNWLHTETLYTEKSIIDSYHAVIGYDESRERKKSFLFAAPLLIAAIPAFLFHRIWLGVIFVLIAAFMLLQHKIGYNLAKESVNNEMYLALPQWLMSIALLLQNNNVQVSIAKSAADAPAVLQKELELLMERLQKEPDQLKSYTDFCKDFDVPEITSCMKMFHAISESGTGNAKVQINNLIQRVNEMQDMADEVRNRKTAFKMKLIFSYPVLGATVKMLIDLTVGMLYMFQMLGSMGVS